AARPPVVPRGDGGAVRGIPVAVARPRRAHLVHGAHGPAPPVHAGGRADAHRRDPGVDVAAGARARVGGADLADDHTSGRRDRDLQRRAVVHALACRGGYGRRARAAALPAARGAGRVGDRYVVADHAAAAGAAAAHAAGPDVVPVRPVARADGAGL